MNKRTGTHRTTRTGAKATGGQVKPAQGSATATTQKRPTPPGVKSPKVDKS